MIDWLRKYKHILSIRAIEQELKMPETILTKAVTGKQELSKKWEKPLSDFIKRLCRSGLEKKEK